MENNSKKTINKFRYEAAKEITPSLLTGYREGMGLGGFSNNSTSGYLVKRMIEAQEKQMGNQGK